MALVANRAEDRPVRDVIADFRSQKAPKFTTFHSQLSGANDHAPDQCEIQAASSHPDPIS
jgi:hypothetical protein